MNIRLFLLSLLCFSSVAALAVEDGLSVSVRAGYNVGGTMPLGMPATIRSLNSYKLQANPQIGVTVNIPFANNWGVETGLKLDRKAMRTDAQVKGYHMNMVQGEESIEGVFTGGVVTKCSTWTLSCPVQVTYNILPELKLMLGPYFGVNLDKQFTGYAYDGYLRKDGPTGERVEIGSTSDQRGEYTFNDNMRNLQAGIDLGADYIIKNGWGVYVDLAFGLTGAFHSNFSTIEQTMFPVYGTIGVVKRF